MFVHPERRPKAEGHGSDVPSAPWRRFDFARSAGYAQRERLGLGGLEQEYSCLI
jgi:hypothetical protein